MTIGHDDVNRTVAVSSQSLLPGWDLPHAIAMLAEAILRSFLVGIVRPVWLMDHPICHRLAAATALLHQIWAEGPGYWINHGIRAPELPLFCLLFVGCWNRQVLGPGASWRVSAHCNCRLDDRPRRGSLKSRDMGLIQLLSTRIPVASKVECRASGEYRATAHYASRPALARMGYDGLDRRSRVNLTFEERGTCLAVVPG